MPHRGWFAFAMSPWGRGCLATGGARTGGGGLAWAQWMRAVQEGECGCLCAGVTFQAVLPGHPKTSPSRGERGGANLGDPERQGETGREGVRASWPSTRTSAGVLHPTFPLPAGRNRSRHEGLSMEQPPQLGGISLPVPHLMDTHPRFLEGRLSSRSPRSYFLGRPLFLPFFPYSPTCQPSPFPCAHGGGQELLPGGLTGGLRGSASSLRLHNTLRSQNRPVNPGLVTILQLYKQHKEFTYGHSRAFDNSIKQLG